MVKEALGKCPVCGQDTEVTSISCGECGTRIEGRFRLCRFCRLTDEQKDFIETFVKCRGNIKDVERELGISYPTVRAKLDDVVTALGYTVAKKPTINSKEIVDMLEKGEISAEQALNIMKEY